MVKKKSNDLGVLWYLPGKSRAFASTTKATSDLIVLFSEDGFTVDEAYEKINYDPEALAVLQVFQDNDLGSKTLKELGIR